MSHMAINMKFSCVCAFFLLYLRGHRPRKLAHLEATATLRSPNTKKNRLKVNFLLVFLVFVHIFLYLCTRFGERAFVSPKP